MKTFSESSEEWVMTDNAERDQTETPVRPLLALIVGFCRLLSFCLSIEIDANAVSVGQ